MKIKDGDKLDEFAIAGADKKFVWADAKIVGKNKIEVSSPDVSQPQAVCYAFNSNPKHPNLTNDVPGNDERNEQNRAKYYAREVWLALLFCGILNFRIEMFGRFCFPVSMRVPTG